MPPDDVPLGQIANCALPLLLNAVQEFLEDISQMTTEDFSLGADHNSRETLQRALAALRGGEA